MQARWSFRQEAQPRSEEGYWAGARELRDSFGAGLWGYWDMQGVGVEGSSMQDLAGARLVWLSG